jgi:hypothetical protein
MSGAVCVAPVAQMLRAQAEREAHRASAVPSWSPSAAAAGWCRSSAARAARCSRSLAATSSPRSASAAAIARAAASAAPPAFVQARLGSDGCCGGCGVSCTISTHYQRAHRPPKRRRSRRHSTSKCGRVT